jgi:hypothetical protein
MTLLTRQKQKTGTENKKHNKTKQSLNSILQPQPQPKDGDILDDNHRKLRKNKQVASLVAGQDPQAEIEIYSRKLT